MGGRTPAEDRAGVARFAAIRRRAPWYALGGVALFGAAFLLHAAPAAAVTAPDPLIPGTEGGSFVSLFGPGTAAPATQPAWATTAAAYTAPPLRPDQVVPDTTAAPGPVGGPVDAATSPPEAALSAAGTDLTAVVRTAAETTRTAVSGASPVSLPAPVVLPAPVQPRRSQAHRPTVLPVLRPVTTPAAPTPAPTLTAPAPHQAPPPAARLGGPPAAPASDGQTGTAPVVSAAVPVDGPALHAASEPTGRHDPAGVPPAPFWILSVTGDAPGAGGGTGAAAVPPSPGPVLVPARSFVWGSPYRAADAGGTRPGHARAPPEERRCPVS